MFSSVGVRYFGLTRRFHDASEKCEFCKDLYFFKSLSDNAETENVHIDIDWALFLASKSCPYRMVIFEAIWCLDRQILSKSARFASRDDNDHRKASAPYHLNIQKYCENFLITRKSKEGYDVGSLGVEIQLSFDGKTKPYITNLKSLDHNNDAERSHAFLHRCLAQCLVHHPRCKELQQSRMPPRLLAIEPRGLRLFEPDAAEAMKYVALSYCWGTEAPLKLEGNTMKSYREGIPNSAIPAVFQDAMSVASEFGVSYLWIDALCIIQDDHDDWVRHTGEMHLIYQNAYLVIAAVTSPNAKIPFLGPKSRTDRSTLDVIGVKSGRYLDARTQISARKHTRRWLGGMQALLDDGGPLDSRAWSWQEKSLSTRCIRYQDGEIIWDCATNRSFEGTPDFHMDNGRSWRIDPAGVTFGAWHSIINEYSSKSLTYKKDRLPAIAGAAAEFSNGLKSKYLAGLWETNLVYDLTWTRSSEIDWGTGYIPVSETSMNTDTKTPSWSWTSIMGRVSWYGAFTQEAGAIEPGQVQILDYWCEPLTRNVFGQIKPGATLRVRGQVLEGILKSSYKGKMVNYTACFDDGDNPEGRLLFMLGGPDSPLIIEHTSKEDGTEESKTRWRRATSEDKHSDILVKTEAPILALMLFKMKESKWIFLSKEFGTGNTYQRIGSWPDEGGLLKANKRVKTKELILV